MSLKDSETNIIAANLVREGGYKGNPLMAKPEIRTAVNQVLEAQGLPTTKSQKKETATQKSDAMIRDEYDASFFND